MLSYSVDHFCTFSGRVTKKINWSIIKAFIKFFLTIVFYKVHRRFQECDDHNFIDIAEDSGSSHPISHDKNKMMFLLIAFSSLCELSLSNAFLSNHKWPPSSGHSRKESGRCTFPNRYVKFLRISIPTDDLKPKTEYLWWWHTILKGTRGCVGSGFNMSVCFST